MLPLVLDIGGVEPTNLLPSHGYVPVDTVNVVDPHGYKPTYATNALDLKGVPQGKYDAVRVSHLLEHIPFFYLRRALVAWMNVLKPGGTLHIIGPDVEASILRVQKDPNNEGHYAELCSSMFGKPDWLSKFLGLEEFGDPMVHKAVIIEAHIRALLLTCGFKAVTRESYHPWHWDYAIGYPIGVPVDVMYLVAVKG